MTPNITSLFKKFYGNIFTREMVHRRVKILLGVLGTTIVFAAFTFDLLSRFELTMIDWRSQFAADRKTSEKIILIDISEDSIESIGRWPWPRNWHATMISLLSEFGAKAILYDVIFSEPSEPVHDIALREAIKQSEKVFLPAVFHFADDESLKGATVPMEMFAKHARGIGHVNVIPDEDGTLRRVPLYLRSGNIYMPQLSYLLAKDAFNFDENRSYANRKISLMDKNGGAVDFTLDQNGNYIIRWAGTWKKTFKHYSFIDLIRDYAVFKQTGKSSDRLNALNGSICLIGLTAHGLYDIKPIPLETTYPAVGVNANIINNILRNETIKPVSGGANCLLIFLIGIIIAGCTTLTVHVVRGLIWTVTVSVSYIAICFFSFKMYGILISMAYPLSAALVVFVFLSFYSEVFASYEKKELQNLARVDELTGLYNVRFFREVLEREFSKSGRRRKRDLSLIITDIDHFKRFNDTYGHQTGDFVLKSVAELLKTGSRNHDFACRYGGEEFIIVLPDTSAQEAYIIAERIRQSIAHHDFRMNGANYNVTVSLGVTDQVDEVDMEALIKRADQALYQAKAKGRNQTVRA